jgi:hypothetical protein
MSNAPPDPAPDASSTGESPDDPDAPDPADDEDDETGGALRTALGALRARLSPAPKDEDQPDD